MWQPKRKQTLTNSNRIIASRCNKICEPSRHNDAFRKLHSFQTVETHCIRVKFQIDGSFEYFSFALIFKQCVQQFQPYLLSAELSNQQRHLSKVFRLQIFGVHSTAYFGENLFDMPFVRSPNWQKLPKNCQPKCTRRGCDYLF